MAIVDTYYGDFLREHYAERPELARASYGEQLDSLLARRFGTADAYSRNLRARGHDAHDLIVNCAPLQARWLAENRPLMGGLVHGLARGSGRAAKGLLPRIVLAQIAQLDPQVVYCQDLWVLPDAVLDRFRRDGRLVAGQIASEAPSAERLRRFDLILTSFPHYVERFRRLGVDAEYFPIAFDETVLDSLAAEGVATDPRAPRSHAAVFVGGLDPGVHPGGVALIERLCRQTDLQVWGYGYDRLPPGSPIRARHRGEAWGLDMYRVLAAARVVVNRHIEAAEGFANNMRLFEGAGVGALVLTEAAPNLADLFEPGREVETYESEGELVAKLERYAADAPVAAEIAAAGQQRVLRDHTYRTRIGELEALLEERVPTG